MSKKTVFTLMMSEKNQQTGELTYNPIAYLTPANITQVEIESDSLEEVVEFSQYPEIIPLGMKSCGASVVGTFDSRGTDANYKQGTSHITPVSNLCQEARLEDTIKLFDKVQDQPRMYAVSLGQKNLGGCRELQGGIWRIDKFNWDRKAKEMGIYRFSMTLGYVWVDKREQQIFDGNTGRNKIGTCKFVAKIEAGGNNGQNGIAAADIVNTVINKSLLKLNTCTFQYPEYIRPDSIVTVDLANSQRTSDKKVFYGVVITCEQDKNGLQIVNCREISDLLYRGVISANAAVDPIFSWLPTVKVVFRNPGKDGAFWKIKDIVYQVLKTYYKPPAGFSYDPGSGVDRTKGKLGDKENLPGPGREETKIETQTFSCISVGKAITNFLYKQCGFYVWYNSQVNGALEYGFTRDPIDIDITREVIETNALVSSRSEDMKPDGVIVWDPTGEYFGYAGELGNGKNILVYTFNDTKSDMAYSAIAHTILESMKNDTQRTYKVKFPAGTVRFKEGDYFNGLGDSTIGQGASGDANMPYRKGADLDPMTDPGDYVWHIKELTIRESGTEVVVGSSNYSITDLYKDSLSRTKDGVAMPIEQKILKCKKVIIGGPSKVTP